MVDSVSGSGGSQNIQQLNRSQNVRAEERRAERADERREVPNAQELSDEQAVEAAQNLARQLSDDENLTISNGQVVDQLL